MNNAGLGWLRRTGIGEAVQTTRFMKHAGNFLPKSAACAALFLTSLATSAQVMEGGAQVTAVRGTALVSEAGGQAFKPLKVGQSLGRGAVIKTSPDSQLDLFLKYNGPAIQAASDTTLCLSALRFEPLLQPWRVVVETRLDLTNGRILGYTQALPPASSYEIRTPRGSIVIQGGGAIYDVSANGTVIINQGSAIVAFTDRGAPLPTIVNAGFTISPPAPSKNQNLLRATSPESFKALMLSISALTKNIPPKFTQGIVPQSQRGSNSSAPAVSTLETNHPVVKP